MTSQSTFISIQRVDPKKKDSEWCVFVLLKGTSVGFYDDGRWETKRAAHQAIRKKYTLVQLVDLSTIIKLMEEFNE